MATTGVPNQLYSASNKPDLVNGAYAGHVHEVAGIDIPENADYTIPVGEAIPITIALYNSANNKLAEFSMNASLVLSTLNSYPNSIYPSHFGRSLGLPYKSTPSNGIASGDIEKVTILADLPNASRYDIRNYIKLVVLYDPSKSGKAMLFIASPLSNPGDEKPYQKIVDTIDGTFLAFICVTFA